MVRSLFVRVKRVGLRRYVYLVEGVRKGERVRQKTLCYLGPVTKLVSGVPYDTMRKVEKKIQLDWNKINDGIGRIPLTFEELSEARRAQYAISIRARRGGFRTQGNLPRTERELSALSKLAAKRFREMFEEIGEREYRMR